MCWISSVYIFRNVLLCSCHSYVVWFKWAPSPLLPSWAASLDFWQWRGGMLWRLCERERDVLCLCCAFSAVLSSFGHSLPCEACRENVSHGVIMTNPPPHTQPPFSSSIFSPLHHHDNRTMPSFSPLLVYNQEARFLVFFALLNRDRTEDIQACVSGGIVVVIVRFVSWLPFYLSHFPVSVTAVKLVKSLLVWMASRSVTVCLCSSLELCWNILTL